MNRRFFLHHFGNSLIVLGIALCVFTYLPLISLWRENPIDTTAIDKSFSLYIPKINAYAPVVENVDPLNEEEYNQQLEKGVAHARGTAVPPQSGTMFLFAHSSNVPWKITRLNTAFLRLHEMEVNDTITMYKNGKAYNYTVFDKKIVPPHDVSYLASKDNQLILQTCYPPGTSFQRLLVFAR